MLRLLIIAAALGLLVPGTASAKSKKARIMLLDIPPDPAFSSNITQAMNEFLAGALTDQGFEVITARDIGAVLGVERQKQLLGCSESSCLAELGGAMGADFIVHGNVAVLDTDTALNLSLIDSKGKPVQLQREMVSGRSSSTLIKALEQMVPKLVAPVKPTAGLAPAPPLAAVSAPAPAGGLTASAAPASSPSRVPAYASFGVGAAGLVAAGVFCGLSFVNHANYVSDFQSGNNGSLAGDKSSTNTFAAVGWASLAVGLAGAAAGTYFLMSEGSGSGGAP